MTTELEPISLADAARAVVENLDTTRQTPERSQHKFKMIRVVERLAAGIAFNQDEAWVEVREAAEFCSAHGA